ncbi:MAG: xanthine dehydrogenase family protein molybdopterin-binding subunit [Hyphomicrobiales bacterium]|nr:xanthine dehydrogenase family protein molybdopterin-binding subunit [Hyphomicrobiales bacterium]
MTLLETNTSRRSFLRGAGAAGLGLVIGFRFEPHGVAGRAAAQNADVFEPNAFIRITPDNIVTIFCKHIEFGQGPFTGFATIIADELDASRDQIQVEHAPADASKYANLFFKIQGTGGSTAMANSWDQLRQAGAEARARLVQAAAEEWGVPSTEITIDGGVLKHASGKQASFGALCQKAAITELKSAATPKTPDQWTYIGKTFPKVDTKPKTNGEAVFTIDVKLPDMLTCVIARPPRFGATPKSFDATAALEVNGVAEVFAVPHGIAVLAKGYWQARKGADALQVEWDESAAETRGSAGIMAHYKELAAKTGQIARNDGDAESALENGATVIEATYSFPYLAHAPLEPNDCVIHRDGDGVELLLGSQLQTIDQMTVAAVLGLKPEQVAIKTMLAGGSFGRRATPASDMAAEAALVLKAAKHQGPIKVIWSREDDIKGGFYRPLFVHKLRGAVDGEGNIVSWDQVIVGQSFVFGSPFEQTLVKHGIDELMVEGASNMEYTIPNLRVSVHREEVGVPTLWWRSVGHTHTAYAVETFLDELAAAAGADELELRRKLLANSPRHLGVLNLVVEKAGWGSPVADGRARGIAVHKSFNTFVAQIAEISKGEDGLPKLEKVWCAVDCGQPINPDVIVAQIQGGVGYGLSGVLYGAIDLEDGRVVQSNFDEYRALRIDEMPEIEVHIVPSTEKPTGIGEPGVPPIGPAVANAWAKLTGQRVKELPFTRGVGNA